MRACPYCSEPIRDEALVCYHCRQCLFDPAELEGTPRARTRPAAPPSGDAPPAGELPLPGMLTAAIGTVVAVLAVFLFSGCFLVVVRGWLPETAILPAILVPPLLLGLLLGATSRGDHPRLYLGLGLLMGGLNLGAARYVLHALPTDPDFNWPWALAILVVGQTLVFTTSGLTGDAIERRWYPSVESGRRPAFRGLWANLQKLRVTVVLQVIVQLLTILGHLELY